MRAIRFHEFGGPEVLRLEEAPEPHPAANQIRIVVNAVGINPVDWKIRSGAMGGEIPADGRPTGVEAAGVVDAVGDDVTDVTAGDEVFGSAIGGAAADFTLMENYAHIPATIDFVAAAGLTVAAETGARVLDLLALTDGQTLLVNGASGAVGLATIQLGRRRGLTVIGTAGRANQDLVREFGAQPTTYGEGLAERVRELAPDGVDGVLDAGPGGPHSALPELVELAGGPEHVVAIADYAGAEQAGVRFTGGSGGERAWYILDQLGPLIEAGEFRLPLARTFELEEIADAHRLGESGQARGKIVVRVD